MKPRVAAQTEAQTQQSAEVVAMTYRGLVRELGVKVVNVRRRLHRWSERRPNFTAHTAACRQQLRDRAKPALTTAKYVAATHLRSRRSQSSPANHGCRIMSRILAARTHTHRLIAAQQTQNEVCLIGNVGSEFNWRLIQDLRYISSMLSEQNGG